MSKITHGKYSTYVNHGCRCDECSAAMAEYGRAQRERRLSEGLPDDDDRHGTKNGYLNWGCRCQACKFAMHTPRFQLREAGFGHEVWIKELGGWYAVGQRVG